MMNFFLYHDIKKMLFLLLIALLLVLAVWHRKKKMLIIASPSLREEDNGGVVHLSIGEKRIIRLKGNATTGYTWRTVALNGETVRIAKDWKYTMAPVPTGFVGGGGEFELQIEAIKPGISEIFLNYDRPFDPQPGYCYMMTFIVACD